MAEITWFPHMAYIISLRSSAEVIIGGRKYTFAFGTFNVKDNLATRMHACTHARHYRHITCRLLICLKMILGCLLLFFKPSKVIPVIKNKNHNCRLDLMEMVLWLLSVQETLVTYMISNYMCSFFIAYD